jgi:hypothetical protein
MEPIRLTFIDDEKDRKERTLVALLCIQGPLLHQLVESALAAAEQRGHYPIFLIDDFCFDLFRARGLAVELLPRARDLGASREAYRRYARAKFELIRAKWDVAHEIVVGASFDSFVEGSVAEAPC